MRSMLLIAATALLVAGSSATLLIAEDKSGDRPFGGPAPPSRHIEERPFGGPPPKNRALQEFSVKCRTEQRTCTLRKRQLVGSQCKCATGDKAAGTVVE